MLHCYFCFIEGSFHSCKKAASFRKNFAKKFLEYIKFFPFTEHRPEGTSLIKTIEKLNLYFDDKITISLSVLELFLSVGGEDSLECIH